ncbi:hypothetical protein V8C42DRAFT_337556, partial [Trichoderma barbatum]
MGLLCALMVPKIRREGKSDFCFLKTLHLVIDNTIRVHFMMEGPTRSALGTVRMQNPAIKQIILIPPPTNDLNDPLN